MVAIKNAAERGDAIEKEIINATFPVNANAFLPFSFTDYVTALRAKKECLTQKGIKGISGIQDAGFDWQVPLVKCDSRKCSIQGENAQPFCEYGIIAVAGKNGGESRASSFKAWVEEKYPAIISDEMPFEFELIQPFDSSEAMDNYIANRQYGETGYPKIAMGIVFDGDSIDNWHYHLRQNSTNFNSPEYEGRPATRTTPDTSRTVDSFAPDDESVCVPEGGTPTLGRLESSCTGQYMYNGVLTFQRLVNDFILDQTNGTAAGYRVAEASILYVPFPTREYVESGFYSTIGGTFLLL